MSNPTFIGLINNTALLLALGMTYGFLLHRKGTFAWKLASGIALGVISIGLMMNPWQLAPGVFFDTRTILMSVGGLFLGVLPMAIAMALSVLYRIHASGAGTLTGVLWILCSGCMGLALAKVHKRPAYLFSTIEFYLFGLVVQSFMLVLMLTMPDGMGVPIIKQIALPVMLIFPLATVLLAKLLANQELQQHNKLKLDLNERKYRDLINNSQAIILRFDTEGRITFFNEFAQTLFGYQEHEILGKNIVDTIIPPGNPVSHSAKSVLDSLQLNRSMQTTHENDNVCRDGRRITVLWKNAPVFDEAGEFTGFQSIGHDITEKRQAENSLKAAEQQFHQLIDVSPVPLAILEKNHTFTYFNRRFTELFGYTLDDLPTIDDWWAQAYPDQQYGALVRQRWMDAASRAIEQKTEFPPQEARVTCKDGTVLDVIASLASIGGQEIVALTDMSRERQLDRLKSEFITTAAHELNTPLCAVMGFTELLLNDDTLDRKAQKEYLDIIFKKTEALEQIIDDLLVLSRAECGQKITLEIKSYDLRDLIDTTLNAFRKEYIDRQFLLECPEHEIGVVPLDRIKTGQVLENLIGNAIKFSLPGTPIQVSGAALGNHVQISVRDQGQGMSPEQATHAFERFYRADMSNTSIQGLGLGLPIVKGIVEAHGGTISIESSLGHGTTVSFTLPQT